MSDKQKIRTEPLLDGQGLHIVLDDPKGNVLDQQMMGELNALLDGLESRPELKLLCFSGAGDHFSFGASVADHVGDRAGPMLKAFHGIFQRLIKLSIPTAAAVRGRCLGGGMEVACFCNRVVAAPGALLGQPEIQLGVLAPKSASSLRWAARASRWQLNQTVLAGITALEQLYLRELMATHDANEGLASFLEKRKPQWKNA